MVTGCCALSGCTVPRAPLVRITPRTQWADAKPIADRLVAHSPKYLTVHHAGVRDDGSVAGDEKMRRLLRFSLRDKPWGDVPYHFVIDRKGNIFAGRSLEFAPDTNTGYDVDGHIGICVNGDLTSQPLVEAQYRSLVGLLAKLSIELDIPLDKIAGHMDYSPGKTNCPGALEHMIRDKQLQRDVRAVLAGRSYDFKPPQFDEAKLTD